MSEAHIESLREIWAEFARGNFAVGRELLADDVVFTWEVPEGDTVCHGPAEVARKLGDFLGQWTNFRSVAQAVEQLDDERVLVVAHQYGRGRSSGVAVEDEVFIVWTFAGDKVVRVEWRFDRERALAASGG